MSSQFPLDVLDSVSPPFAGGRHRAPEPEPVLERRPVAPPPWAVDEHARQIDLVGEGPTRILHVPPMPQAVSLPMPLPARAEGAALSAESAPLPKWDLLGRRLQALRKWGRP